MNLQHIIGKQVVLAGQSYSPKIIKGIESHGMILMAEAADGTWLFCSPTKALTMGQLYHKR
jgi:tRNA-binding EMAP/Myf-like protein